MKKTSQVIIEGKEDENIQQYSEIGMKETVSGKKVVKNRVHCSNVILFGYFSYLYGYVLVKTKLQHES